VTLTYTEIRNREIWGQIYFFVQPGQEKQRLVRK